MKFSPIDWVAFVLTIVGGLNWGLNAFLNLNLVTALFSSVPIVGQVVYALVALSALYLVYWLFKNQKA